MLVHLGLIAQATVQQQQVVRGIENCLIAAADACRRQEAPLPNA